MTFWVKPTQQAQQPSKSVQKTAPQPKVTTCPGGNSFSLTGVSGCFQECNGALILKGTPCATTTTQSHPTPVKKTTVTYTKCKDGSYSNTGSIGCYTLCHNGLYVAKPTVCPTSTLVLLIWDTNHSFKVHKRLTSNRLFFHFIPFASFSSFYKPNFPSFVYSIKGHHVV
jgi:hypothetical protein